MADAAVGRMINACATARAFKDETAPVILQATAYD